MAYDIRPRGDAWNSFAAVGAITGRLDASLRREKDFERIPGRAPYRPAQRAHEAGGPRAEKFRKDEGNAANPGVRFQMGTDVLRTGTAAAKLGDITTVAHPQTPQARMQQSGRCWCCSSTGGWGPRPGCSQRIPARDSMRAAGAATATKACNRSAKSAIAPRATRVPIDPRRRMSIA